MSTNSNLEKVNNLPLDTWIYDIEIFKKFWCVVFINAKTRDVKVFKKGEYLKLREFVLNKLKGKFVGGYNNVNYDDFILRELIAGNSGYELNDWIINKRAKPWEFEKLKLAPKLPFFSFDLMQMLGTGRIGLKKYQGFLGLSIVESPVHFSYTSDLTQEQIDGVVNYCISDVKSTLYLFIKFIDQFVIKQQMIVDNRLESRMLSKTMAQITARIFEADKTLVPRYKSYDYKAPDNVRQLYQRALPQYLWLIKKLENMTFYTEFHEHYQRNQVDFNIEHKGLTYSFKSGGLHAAKNIIIDAPVNIVNKDIVNNYPHLIGLYNYGSRASKNMSKLIMKFIAERKEAKKAKEMIKSNYLKELVVRPFGAMEYKFNDLWDPRQRMAVCLTGELIMFFLSVKLSEHVEILQVNTDGVMYAYETEAQRLKAEKIASAWEKITLMTLETDCFDMLYQKDVNNYILVDSKNPDRNKTKGSMVKYWKQQYHNPEFNTVRGSANNNLTVLDKAVYHYFVNKIPPRQTIDAESDAVCFQFIFDIKGAYTHVITNNQIIDDHKVFRIFYTKHGNPVFKAFQKENGEWKKDKVALSSEHSTIYNHKVLGLDVKTLDLDLDYYEQLAWERIRMFENSPQTGEKMQVLYPGESYDCALCGTSLENELVVRTIYDDELEVCKVCYFSKK
ncbi:hypothetical protein HLA87_02535 [Mycoplasma miroungigenitalium]|uniref:Uncharacterized protein n=1 Tax=Mycoplasma miroungigenitalium TaxID=754515 RepID=A0A6M4JG32_9MOLU|nr:hypothetical protein [Mycoplasma miroungigenitalium]QJR43651.1 hypothetical protein HLA87_02535 [Mycoplasma miroungigenitalium]